MGQILGKLGIMQKLSIIVAIAALGMAAVGGLAMSELHQNLLEDRKIKVKHVVETAYGVVEYFAAQFNAGAMTREAAQKSALEAVKTLRYEGDEYFWVNDMQTVMLMHPYKPELDGQDMSGFSDPNGKKLFAEFVAEVRRNGSGYVDYLWPKPGEREPVAKVSYVKGYAPWGWVVGSGVYMDDVNGIFWFHASEFIGVGVAVLVVMGLIAVLLVKSVTSPLGRLRSVMVAVESSGDLSQRSGIDQSDELGDMARAFDRMLDKFQGFFYEVEQAVDQVSAAAANLGAITDNSSAKVQSELMQTDQVATAMNEMAATVQEVSRNAAEAAHSAQSADHETGTGKQVVSATMSSIDNLAGEVERAAEVIHKLEADTESIGKVLDVIRGIAEQTNLLALNAAIEAARAGEQGRGFAVVADEVRTLAQRTQESTEEIQQMIETLQSGAKNAVQVMESGRSQAQASVQQAAKAGHSLESITQAVARISDMNTQIASAAEEQGAVAEEILRNVVTITHGVQETARDAQSISAAGAELKQLSQRLEVQVGQFR